MDEESVGVKLLKDILTGADNTTYDSGRVLSFISHLIYFILAVGSIVAGHPWAPIDFASGVGAMAIGTGLNLKLKENSEPRSR